jgi:tRNA-dihydrouridine synthase B
MFHIGPYSIESPTILAPMAGVTDRPFRRLCKQMGAGLVVSEMVTSDVKLWESRKSKLRLDHSGESSPISVQIAGGDPDMMAQAARMNEAMGAQIIDINMGCPAKKVCNKAAGSALLKDVALVNEILEAVVNAVSIPVTLKIRTGWCPDTKNALEVATLAAQKGIQALTIHGRTRSCAFKADVEYDTIKQVKQAINIPVIANGEIRTPQQAADVLNYTGADAVMIGRAAQGRPWIFREINHFLATGELLQPPSWQEVKRILLEHLEQLHQFYGEVMGVRIARKHVGWYLQTQDQSKEFRKKFNAIDCPAKQHRAICAYLKHLKTIKELAA